MNAESDQAAEEIILRAKQDLKAGTAEGIQAAFALLNEAARTHPDQAEIWFLLGSILDDAEIDQESTITIERLWSTVSPTGERFTQADAWERALALDPRNEARWYRLGDLYDGCEETEKAARCFSKVVELNPNHVEGWVQLASQLHSLAISGERYSEIKLKNPTLAQQAVDAFHHAIDIDETKAAGWEAYYWLGELALLFGDKKAAVQWFSRQHELTGDGYCAEQADELRAELAKG